MRLEAVTTEGTLSWGLNMCRFWAGKMLEAEGMAQAKVEMLGSSREKVCER